MWTVVVAVLCAVFAGAVVAAVMTRRIRSYELALRQSGFLPESVIDLVEVLDVPVLIVDGSHNVVASSPAALALGLARNRLLSVAMMSDMVDEVHEQQNASSEYFSYRNRSELRRDMIIPRDPSGTQTVDLAVHAVAFGARHTVIIAVDKTEFRRLDEVRRDFVANISHELKTPIGAVTLLAEALVEAADDPALVRKFAGSLGDEAARLADLTAEIIELSRLQSEGALAQFHRVSIGDVLTQAITHTRVASDSKALSVVVGGDVDCETYGDAPRLVMAFRNLLANAVQYSPAGSKIGIGVSQRKGYIEVAIADQGIGMTDSEVARIFERFYRTDEARSRLTGGTGLGLSLVKHVVAHHGGDISVWSKPGRGSTFTVRLPDAAAALSRKPAKSRKTTKKSSSSKKKAR